MFSRCSSLTSIDLSILNNISIIKMGHIFEGCSSLTSFDLTYLKTEKVEDMSYMFSECNVLESIDLSNIITSNAKNMTKMFYKCEKLVNLNLSTFNTDKVNDMSNIFYGMNSLKYLDISNFNMNECNYFDDMFSNISNIRYINIKNLNNDKTISTTFNQRTDLFYVCEILTIIDNQNAYKCCEYNMTTDKCDEIIPTTIPTTFLSTMLTTFPFGVPTTIPNGSSTTTFISTYIPTTIQILSSTVLTTIPEIINFTITTTIVTEETTNENIQTNIPKTMNESIPSTIEKTEKTTNFQTNEKSTTTTKDEENINILSSAISEKTEKESTSKITEKIKYINETILTNEIKEDTKQAEITTNHIDNQTTIIFTTPEKNESILTNIPQIMDNTYSATTIKEIMSTTMPTTIPTKTPTTLPTTELKAPNKTIISSTTVNNEEASAVVLGYSKKESNSNNYFSFYMYLLAIKNKLNSDKAKIPATVSNNQRIRMLKETKGNCILNNIINTNNYQFLCEIHEDISNAKSISIKPELKFFPENNIIIVGISPIAFMVMNNLLLCDERFDFLSNRNIYVMDNSVNELYDKSLFNITGTINGTQPKIENKNLSLMSNLISDEQNLQTEIDCVIDNISTDRYLLNCKRNRTLEIDLQSSISFIEDNGIIVFNFSNNSIIKAENKISYSKLFRNKQTGLNAGAIVALIISLLVVFAIVIFLFYYFRKKDRTIIDNRADNSTLRNLKVDETQTI